MEAILKNSARDNCSAMRNPINDNFDWSFLYQRYDNTCRRFAPTSPYLYDITEKPKNDRYLYNSLVYKVNNERTMKGYIGLGTYEAILYWKLYSQPAATQNVCAKLRNDEHKQRTIDTALIGLGAQLPLKVTEDISSIINLYDLLDAYGPQLYGLMNPCALPARTTLLHFLYPNVVPLFDKQVLLAVGVNEKNANRRRDCLYQYIQFAWRESKKSNIPKDWQESPLRLFDMALWVTRGQTTTNCERKKNEAATYRNH